MRKVIKDICDVPKNNKGSFLWKECIGSKILLDDGEFIIDNYNTSNRTFSIIYGGILFFMTYVEFRKMLIEHKVNRIPFTHPIINNYFIGGIREAINYSHGSTKDVNMQCPYCNRKRIYKPSYVTRKGIMPCICNKKGMSYPEIVMFYLLEDCNEDFDRETRFDWCNFQMHNYNTYGLFDFVLPYKKIIIEMDGGFHNDEDVLFRDKQKDNLATKNGFKVIRIDSTKSDIKFLKNNIENSELSLYLNLSNVVWEEIEMKARGNIYKEICEFKLKNPNAFVPDIAKHFKLKNDFVRNALKSGNDMGWCVYNPKEEIKRSNRTHNIGFKKGVKHDISQKYIEICKYDLNGNYIETFPSKKDAEKIYGHGVYSCTCDSSDKYHHLTAGGYQWRIKTNKYKENIGIAQ